MGTIKSILVKYPIFLYLLPVFFVLHGYISNYDFVPVSDALLLTGTYLAASAIIAALCWLLYRDFTRANFAAFLAMCYHFFFGSVHDLIKKITPDSFLTKYSFILPFSLLLFIIIFIIIKKSKSGFAKTRLYLNILLLVIIVLDLFSLGSILVKPKKDIQLPAGFIACDTCPKPDVYLLLADEYAGQKELKNLFQFDNSKFLNQLAERGFYTIPESVSNYNYTPFSMASILDMQYLELENRYRQKNDLTYSYEIIKESKLIRFFKANGYEFYNYSIFDFEGQLAPINKGFLPVKTKLITAQTFLSRIDRDIRYNLITKWNSESELKKRIYSNKINNERLYNLTKAIVDKKAPKPKFIYTHFEMPHYPYYFDKDGNEQPFEKLIEGYQITKSAYISYLQYSNKVLMELIDHILKNSKEPPIIVLMGDHGFRHFVEEVDDKYHFLNLTSIHLPDKNYTSINDSLSGVNIFRLILNKNFGQQLQYLKDSTSYLND